ncbi:MAG: TPM domain-containing protein [Clostridia bacterium]|nr:TPM domain-containing protein [Clostridia bacterium]
MKKYLTIGWILLALTALVLLPASAAVGVPRLADEAGVLSDSAAQTLLARLDSISEAQAVDVAVYITPSTGGASAEEYADSLFEAMQYGMNVDRSCILLLINTEGEWHITTAGYGITAVTDVGLDYMAEQFVPYLSAGDYAQAISVYADLAADFLARARSGNPFDADDLPKAPFPVVRNLLVSLGIGFVAGLIIVGKQKAKLFSVQKQHTAQKYTKQGSMAVLAAEEIFLYQTVERREKSEKSNSASSTHQTSSGTTVGGGGGRF